MAWISWDNDEKTVVGDAVATEDCVDDVLTLLALCRRFPATGPVSLFYVQLRLEPASYSFQLWPTIVS